MLLREELGEARIWLNVGLWKIKGVGTEAQARAEIKL